MKCLTIVSNSEKWQAIQDSKKCLHIKQSYTKSFGMFRLNFYTPLNLNLLAQEGKIYKFDSKICPN